MKYKKYIIDDIYMGDIIISDITIFDGILSVAEINELYNKVVKNEM